jgi:glycerophosphoryl diester phosphodiesterase
MEDRKIMKKNYLQFVCGLTLAISLISCGNSNTGISLADNNQVSESSLFSHQDLTYPKVHPKYYHQKYPIVVMGHRGFKDVAPENTMGSFKKTLQVGADMIELDVHLSKDGELIVMHDATVDRTTNGTGAIKDKTLEELKKLDAGSKFSPVFKDERIPTLEEVLQFAKDKISVNIEIKKEAVEENPAPGMGVEEKVANLVAKYDMVEHVIICSFSPLALSRIKQINPMLPTGYLIVTEPFLTSQVNMAAKVKADAVHEYRSFVSKREIENAHKYNIHENVWTVDKPHNMADLIDRGVDALITDRPDLALKVLAEKFPGRK